MIALNKIRVSAQTARFVDKSAFDQDEAKRRNLLRPFDVPPLVYTSFGARCNGYFGSKGVRNKAGQIETYSKSSCGNKSGVCGLLMLSAAIWFRCLVKMAHPITKTGKRYTWYEMTFIGRWEPGRSVILCIDTPDDLPSRLAQSIAEQQEMIDLSNPFALYVPLVDQVVDLYDRSVWGFRDLIRGVEKVWSPFPQANRTEITDRLCRAENRRRIPTFQNCMRFLDTQLTQLRRWL